MSPTTVMTSAWWLDTTPQACWPLLSNAQDQRTAEPGRSIDWQLQGDLQGSLTWVLTPVLQRGCDVTCRWEAPALRIGPAWLRSWVLLLMERNHFARTRRCAQDMAAELGCQTARLREWSGRTHR